MGLLIPWRRRCPRFGQAADRKSGCTVFFQPGPGHSGAVAVSVRLDNAAHRRAHRLFDQWPLLCIASRSTNAQQCFSYSSFVIAIHPISIQNTTGNLTPRAPGMQRPPAVNAALLQSVQCFLTESRVVPAHLLHKQFGLFAHCGAISRAAAFDDGQPGVVYRAFYLAFGGKDHWPDQRNVALVQDRSRAKNTQYGLPAKGSCKKSPRHHPGGAPAPLCCSQVPARQRAVPRAAFWHTARRGSALCGNQIPRGRYPCAVFRKECLPAQTGPQVAGSRLPPRQSAGPA